MPTCTEPNCRYRIQTSTSSNSKMREHYMLKHMLHWAPPDTRRQGADAQPTTAPATPEDVEQYQQRHAHSNVAATVRMSNYRKRVMPADDPQLVPNQTSRQTSSTSSTSAASSSRPRGGAFAALQREFLETPPPPAGNTGRPARGNSPLVYDMGERFEPLDTQMMGEDTMASGADIEGGHRGSGDSQRGGRSRSRSPSPNRSGESDGEMPPLELERRSRNNTPDHRLTMPCWHRPPTQMASYRLAQCCHHLRPFQPPA